ncbi:MAG: hypothetical protein ACR2OW_05370 [Methyloligellaceae bacterium]
MGSNLFATLISAFALLFSGYSFYESVVRAPQMEIFVPPKINYTDPDRPDNPFEVFIVPLTLANDGARTGTVLSIVLEVKNSKSGARKKFIASKLGTWGNESGEAFAPIVLPGKGSVSESIQFFPQVGENVPRILDLEPGSYDFRIILDVASAGSDSLFAPKLNPLSFSMQAGQMDYRRFTGSGTMEMWSANYQSATTQSVEQ